MHEGQHPVKPVPLHVQCPQRLSIGERSRYRVKDKGTEPPPRSVTVNDPELFEVLRSIKHIQDMFKDRFGRREMFAFPFWDLTAEKRQYSMAHRRVCWGSLGWLWRYTEFLVYKEVAAGDTHRLDSLLQLNVPKFPNSGWFFDIL